MRKNQREQWLTGTLVLIAGIGFIAAPSGAQQDLLRITSPASGTVVRPGQTVTISVSADYSVEKLALFGQHPLGVGQVFSGGVGVVARGQGELRPLQFVLRIPKEIQPGIYRVTAIGRVSDGDVESEALTLDVEKAQEPVRIWAEPTSIQFTRSGDRIPLRVLGAFSDASNEELTKSTKTTFASADPRVATVGAGGMVTALAPGKTTIQVHTPTSDYSIPVRVE
jgi:Bacterial Ig-like domain (group 2)